MAENGDLKRGDDRWSSDSVDGDRSWARVIQGVPHGASWIFHRISEEEIDQLQGCFTKVLKLVQAMMEDSRC